MQFCLLTCIVVPYNSNAHIASIQISGNWLTPSKRKVAELYIPKLDIGSNGVGLISEFVEIQEINVPLPLIPSFSAEAGIAFMHNRFGIETKLGLSGTDTFLAGSKLIKFSEPIFFKLGLVFKATDWLLFGCGARLSRLALKLKWSDGEKNTAIADNVPVKYRLDKPLSGSGWEWSLYGDMSVLIPITAHVKLIGTAGVFGSLSGTSLKCEPPLLKHTDCIQRILHSQGDEKYEKISIQSRNDSGTVLLSCNTFKGDDQQGKEKFLDRYKYLEGKRFYDSRPHLVELYTRIVTRLSIGLVYER